MQQLETTLLAYIFSCSLLNKESLCSHFYNHSSLVYVTGTVDYDSIEAALYEWTDELSDDYEDVNSTCYLQMLHSVCVLLYPPCDEDIQHTTLCHNTQCLNYIIEHCDEPVRIVNMYSTDGGTNAKYHLSLQSLCNASEYLLGKFVPSFVVV